MRIADLGMVKHRRLNYRIPRPLRAESILVAQQNAEVVRASERAGGRQRGLLDEVVLRLVPVKRPAQEPVRTRRLIPVKPCGEEPVAEWNQRRGRDIDRRDSWNQPG